jgi:hypothetical protein
MPPHGRKHVVQLDIDGREGQKAGHDNLVRRLAVPAAPEQAGGRACQDRACCGAPELASRDAWGARSVAGRAGVVHGTLMDVRAARATGAGGGGSRTTGAEGSRGAASWCGMEPPSDPRSCARQCRRSR